MKSLFLLFVSISSSASAQSTSITDVYEHLDITSFNSSLMPKRMGDERAFSDFDIKWKVDFQENSFQVKSDSWEYKLEVVETFGEDLHVCFRDKALQGSYNTQAPMVLRQYGDYFVATNLVTDVCEKISL